MKTLRSLILWCCCFLPVLLVLAGCESASVVTRPVAVPGRLGGVTVAPVAAPDKVLHTVKSTVIVSSGIAGAPIVAVLAWDATDTANLQQSLVSSLGAGRGAGCVLQVHLAAAGITDMVMPTCQLTGSLALTRGGRTIAARPFNIKARVLSAASVAKDKAITQLLGEVGLLLQSAP